MKKDNVNYNKLSKKRLIEMVTKASILVNRWTEGIILIAAELFIIYPDHEIFKKNFFNKNTLALILHRARVMLEISKIKRVIVEYSDETPTFVHNIENIEKICEKYEKGLE